MVELALYTAVGCLSFGFFSIAASNHPVTNVVAAALWPLAWLVIAGAVLADQVQK